MALAASSRVGQKIAAVVLAGRARGTGWIVRQGSGGPLLRSTLGACGVLRFSTSKDDSGPVADFRTNEINLTRWSQQLQAKEEYQKKKTQEQEALDEILTRKKAAVKDMEAAASRERAAASSERMAAARERAAASSDREEAKKHKEEAKKHEEEAKKHKEDKEGDSEEKNGQNSSNTDEGGPKKYSFKGLWKMLWNYLGKQDFTVYMYPASSLVLIVVLQGGRPVNKEFVRNLADVVKENVLSIPIEMVAEARRRTDGVQKEPPVRFNIVFQMDGHRVRVSEVELSAAELSALKAIQARSSGGNSSK